MKKVFSLLLTICMALVVCTPSTYAAENLDSALKTSQFIDAGEIERAIPSMMDEENEVNPLIVVAEGSKAIITRITVYPGIIVANKPKFDFSLKITTAFYGTQTGGTLRVSSAQTQSLLDRYLENAGQPAEIWLMEVRYYVYNDSRGSYGEYFEFSPVGDLVYPDTESSGKVKIDLARTTVDQEYSLLSAFKIAENTTTEYRIGLSGGFWYYNCNTRKTLSQSAHAYVYFNSTT